MSARYVYTTLHIADLDRSLAFYRDVMGMKVVRQYKIEEVNEDIAVIEQESGGCIELVARKGFELKLTDQENFSLAFEVEDAKSIISKLGSDYTTIDPTPGTKFYFTKDPDGYVLNLIEHSGN
ncbi:MAG: VOC family protein [Coriobacteriales bacterium]|jgi:lactoylglutathione lyase